jgi:hypothetical protein
LVGVGRRRRKKLLVDISIYGSTENRKQKTENKYSMCSPYTTILNIVQQTNFSMTNIGRELAKS